MKRPLSADQPATSQASQPARGRHIARCSQLRKVTCLQLPFLRKWSDSNVGLHGNGHNMSQPQKLGKYSNSWVHTDVRTGLLETVVSVLRAASASARGALVPAVAEVGPPQDVELHRGFDEEDPREHVVNNLGEIGA